MPGTKIGGAKARDTNKSKYGKDYYARIGAKGGKVKSKKGFYLNRELARRAGRLGGQISKRRKKSA